MNRLSNRCGIGRLVACGQFRIGATWLQTLCLQLSCCLLAFSLWFLHSPTKALGNDETAADGSVAAEFEAVVLPVLQSACLECHDAVTREAELDLSSFTSPSAVIQSFAVWDIVASRIAAGDMPPLDSGIEVSPEQREKLLDWTAMLRSQEAQRNAGDPGVVLARRLSNSEYDHSIRDLTGFDIRPTATFPVDPANEAGFDNSGDSLTMSPALLTKYLEAARGVAEHIVFTPNELRFAPYPVVTDTDRDKYCVKRIVDFYQRQPTDLARYFQAAMIVRQQADGAGSEAAIARVAGENKLSPQYLQTVWSALEETLVEYGPLAHLQQQWKQVPSDADSAWQQKQSVLWRDYVRSARRWYEPFFENLHCNGIHDGSQAFVLWKNKQYAGERQTAHFRFLQPDEKNPVDFSQLPPAVAPPSDGELLSAYRRDCEIFCELFPDTFYVSERGRDYLGVPKEKQEKGRLLSAGFHSMMGYFRDDQPLMELILDEAGRSELNRLWDELNYFAAAPLRQYQGMLWFERTDSGFLRDAEFDFARPEDLESLTEPMIARLGELYLAKAKRNQADQSAMQAIGDYFTEINEQIRWVEQQRSDSESRHVEAIVDFAQRAFRRLLSPEEQQSLRAFYHQLRKDEGLGHEESIQDLLVSVLISPHFCYRWDLISSSPVAEPVDDFALASRLSYFLWASAPDEQLLKRAAAGELRREEVLVAEVHRMLTDERVRGLATEFAGNWLDFRRFEEHNSVDRQRFPQFDDELRRAMFEEPVRFLCELCQQDLPITDLLDSDWTFVNKTLADHYGISSTFEDPQQWKRVEGIQSYGRGGLLSMAVFLTKNAPGLRTSPVKRGYWVVKRLLGEHIPAPPPNVPELPNDESQLGELTLRQMLAKHREHSSCSGCHERFDSIGVAFEGFGPIGELRQVDLGGKPVDTRAEFPDGIERTGVSELRSYLLETRRAEFEDNFCRKLLAFALNRNLILSDEILIEQMKQRGAGESQRIRSYIETIVTSPVFLSKRGQGEG